MKGLKTKTSIEVGDLIKAKNIVFSYSGESGTSDADTAYEGDDLGIVTKIMGSMIIYKETYSGRIRNTVSGGSIDFSVNPNYDYVAIKQEDSTQWWQKVLDAGLSILKGTQTTTNTGNTDNSGSDSGSDSGSGSGSGDNKDDGEKTFFEQYGVFAIGAIILAILGYLLFGNKKNKIPQVMQPQYAPPVAQYNPPQYKTQRL